LGHSIRFMATAWQWDEAKVRRFLSSLKSAKIIDAGSDAGQTVITICKYEIYQAPTKPADAANDDGSPQHHRGDDAKYKEGKERNNFSPAPAREGGAYTFDGATIRLKSADFERWKAIYSAIPDIRAELSAIDDWWQGQPEDRRKKWFNATSGMLAKKHQDYLGKKHAGVEPGQGVSADAFDAAALRYQRYLAQMGDAGNA